MTRFNKKFTTSELKRKSVRGALWTFAAQGVKLLCQFASVVALARLLCPEDYGLVGMAAVFTNFIFVIKDLGLSQAAVQKKVLLPEESCALFWINVIVAAGLALVCCAIAPAVSNFYGESRLTNIILLSSISYVILGFSSQHSALLRRQMRMKELAYADIVAKVLALFVGIGCAVAGLNYWSLVWMTIANAAATTALLWHYSRWRPTRVSLRHGGECLRFGLDVAAFNIVNFFSRNIDTMLIGKYHPVATVGLYNKAHQAIMFPIQHIRGPILQVANPALARLQDQPVRFRSYFKKMVNALAVVSMLPVAITIPYAEEFVLVFLGPKWINAAPVLMLLSISALIQPSASVRGTVMLAVGRSRSYFYWGLINALLTVAGFAVAAPYGIEEMAIAYAIVNYGILVPSWIFAAYKTPVRWFDYFAVTWRSFLSSGTAIATGFIIEPSLLELGFSAPFRLMLGGLIFLMIWSLCFCATPNGRKELYDLKDNLLESFAKRNKT